MKWINFKFEFAGTFLLVFFGLGAVAVDVTSGGALGLPAVAMVWGLALMVGIFICGSTTGAHFNPAITIAFCLFRGLKWRMAFIYMVAQFTGAAAAALAVFFTFSGAVAEFESSSMFVRGQPGSEASAMIFGEFYPNPGGEPFVAGNDSAFVTPFNAFWGELMGTFLLALAVFSLTDPKNEGRPKHMTAFAVGGTLSILICLFAPITMAGFNPARDFAPRLMSSFLGWGALPFQVNGFGWLIVYMLAPILGAVCGAGLSVLLFRDQKHEARV